MLVHLKRGLTATIKQEHVTMTNEYSQPASGAICFAADMVKIAWQEAAWELMRPAILYKPALSIDRNKWCALLR